MDSRLPRWGDLAWRPLRLCIFALLLVATSCSRYPNAEAAQAHVTGVQASGVRAETQEPNLDPSQLSKWNQLVQETIEQSARERCVVLIINKYRHTLSAYKNGYRVAEYAVGLGPDAVPKRLRGDGTTPEGKYQIVNKFGPAETKYQKAFVLNYPNVQDRRAFRMLQRGSPKRLETGGNIAIHGTGGQDKKWTFGGIALDKESFDELYPYVGVRTPVTIVPDETVQPERKHHGGQ